MAEKKKQSDEKLLLGLGIVACIGLIAWAVIGFLSLETKFQEEGGAPEDLKVLSGEERLEIAAKSLTNPPIWKETKIKGRSLGLLNSIPLFQVPETTGLIDLLSEDEKPVHEPIPNAWWLKYKLDPSYKDSLKRDADEDGFSNLEEFNGETDPTDPTSYPELLSKLSVSSSESVTWLLTFSSDIGGNTPYQFRYEDTKRARLRSEYIGVGSRFFEKEPANSRYVLKEVKEKEVERSGVTTEIKFATIEDTQKNKVFEVPRGKHKQKWKDYQVSFVLDALDKKGAPFTLKENTRFDLPDGAVSDQGKFHFVEVRENSKVIIQYQKGDKMEEIALQLN